MRTTRTRLWVFLLLSYLASCTHQARHPTPAIVEPQPINVPGLENAVQVGDILFGGQPSPAALKQLASQGYKTVLSTRGPDELEWDERALADSLGLRFVTIPMEKPVTAITDDQVRRFAEFIRKAETPMIAHCSSGNRVAGLWTVWLVESKGVAPDEALRLGDKAGMTGIRQVVVQRLGIESEE